MTEQPPTPLTQEQREDLLRYADNRPHKFEKPPNRNLIRRNLVHHYAITGDKGYYQITEFGRAVLESEKPESRDEEIDRLVRDVLHHNLAWTESLKRLEELARG